MAERFTESELELAALSWFEELGYDTISGPVIAPGEDDAERESFNDVVLNVRLEEAIARLNPDIRLTLAKKLSARCSGRTPQL